MRVDRRYGWLFVATLSVGSTFAAAVSFTAGIEVVLLPAVLDEVSGLAQSRTDPDVFWVHNDSGDQPRVSSSAPRAIAGRAA